METIAGLVANLYGDDSDPEFSAAEPWVATVSELEDSLRVALAGRDHEVANVIATEIRRLRGLPMQPTTPGHLYGSKAGLWRLH